MAIKRQRSDYAFPFRISPTSGQAAQSSYPTHVDEMIRQVLLTAPGERVDLPDFGCGLRRMLFAPNTGGSPPAPGLEGVVTGDAAGASVQLLVRQALGRWLAGIIEVAQISLTPDGESHEGELLVELGYRLIDTQESRQLQVKVR
jgi:phage baseplate assembly protein W